MTTNRREFLAASASLIGLATVGRAAWPQSGIPAAPPAANDATPLPPSTAATKLLFAEIGDQDWAELHRRLLTTNQNIQSRGLRHIPGVSQTLLTGYPYNEFYDWDLYFENMYLSYYGVWQYCFTNLKEFLDRQQPDGYISRSLIKQRELQHFKPFLAQLVVLLSLIHI